MGTNLTWQELIRFIQGDFEAAWDSLAANQAASSRGNFMLAKQAMTLLEVVGRICESDPTGGMIKTISTQIEARDKRYFTVLPNGCETKMSREFSLPSIGAHPNRQLLSALFDLIRNGQAHQYQQIGVKLAGGSEFGVTLTGPHPGRFLRKSPAGIRKSEHLSYSIDASGILWLKVRTELLYLDIRDSLRDSSMIGQQLSFNHLDREWKCAQFDLEKAFSSAGHTKR